MLIIRLVLNALAVYLTSKLLSAGVTVDSYAAALVVAVVLGLINTFIKPVLNVLTLPVTIMTLGLFTLVLDALMVMLADYFITGFSVASFLWAVLFSLVLSIISSILYKLAK